MYIFSLAWRYTRGRLVNLIAVLAVALALTVQIVVMAVLDGMLVDMERRVRSVGEQLVVSFQGELPDRDDFERAQTASKAIPGVKGLSPVIRQFALAEKDREFALVLAYGIDLDLEGRYSELPNYLLDEKIDRSEPKWPKLDNPANRTPVFLSARVAEQLGTYAGDEVTIAFFREGKGEKAYRKTFIVASTFRSGSPYMDEMGVYMPIDAAREMFLQTQEKKIERIAVWLDDPSKAEELEPPISSAILEAVGLRDGMRAYSRSWLQRWRSLYSGMAHENMLQEIVLALMNLSGGFCVFAIMASLVSRRGRDAGLLRCIGAGRGKVVLVFLVVGLIIGLAGGALGVAGGYFCAPRVDEWYEAITGRSLYPPRMYGITELTIAIYPWKVALYSLGAVLISVLAAAYPALWAGMRQPMEALRDE